MILMTEKLLPNLVKNKDPKTEERLRVMEAIKQDDTCLVSEEYDYDGHRFKIRAYYSKVPGKTVTCVDHEFVLDPETGKALEVVE